MWWKVVDDVFCGTISNILYFVLCSFQDFNLLVVYLHPICSFFADNFINVVIKYYICNITYSALSSSCLFLILFKRIFFFWCLLFSSASMICRDILLHSWKLTFTANFVRANNGIRLFVLHVNKKSISHLFIFFNNTLFIKNNISLEIHPAYSG